MRKTCTLTNKQKEIALAVTKRLHERTGGRAGPATTQQKNTSRHKQHHIPEDIKVEEREARDEKYQDQEQPEARLVRVPFPVEDFKGQPGVRIRVGFVVVRQVVEEVDHKKVDAQPGELRLVLGGDEHLVDELVCFDFGRWGGGVGGAGTVKAK